MKQVLVQGDRVIKPADGVTVLIYHRVGGGSDSEVDLDVDAFRAQLEHLRDHHTVIDLDTAAAVAVGRRRWRGSGPAGAGRRGHLRRRHRRLLRRRGAGAGRVRHPRDAVRGHPLHRQRRAVPVGCAAGQLGGPARRRVHRARHHRLAHPHPRPARPGRPRRDRRRTRPLHRTDRRTHRHAARPLRLPEGAARLGGRRSRGAPPVHHRRPRPQPRQRARQDRSAPAVAHADPAQRRPRLLRRQGRRRAAPRRRTPRAGRPESSTAAPPADRGRSRRARRSGPRGRPGDGVDAPRRAPHGRSRRRRRPVRQHRGPPAGERPGAGGVRPGCDRRRPRRLPSPAGRGAPRRAAEFARRRGSERRGVGAVPLGRHPPRRVEGLRHRTARLPGSGDAGHRRRRRADRPRRPRVRHRHPGARRPPPHGAGVPRRAGSAATARTSP